MSDAHGDANYRKVVEELLRRHDTAGATAETQERVLFREIIELKDKTITSLEEQVRSYKAAVDLLTASKGADA